MDDRHWYELTLRPTAAQAEELRALLGADRDALSGADLIEPLAPGWVAVQGVSGAVCAGTHWDRQLPPWAQVVLGREYPCGGRQLPIPALQDARRANWAEIRREPYGWTLDLEFVWDAYPGWQLRCGVDTEGEGRAELRVLMGDGTPATWPATSPLPQG